MSTHIEELLKKVDGGQDLLDAIERERSSHPPETARKIREEGSLMHLERAGIIRRGSGKLPANFWDLPRPEDPDNSVRRALEEDRR